MGAERRAGALLVAAVVLAGCPGGVDDESAFCDVLATDLWVRQNDGEPVDAIVFVEPDASEGQTRDLLDEIEGDRLVVSTSFVSQEEAYDEFVELFENTPEMVEAVRPGVLPASIRVDLSDEAESEAVEWADQHEDAAAVFRVETAEVVFPNGRLLVDAVVRPLTTDPGGGRATVSGLRPEVIDDLAAAAPTDHAADVDVIRGALGEEGALDWGVVELTPEVMEAARSITAYYDTTCVES